MYDLLMKKDIGLFRIAFAFAGSVLGAGYVSGQELWLYFGSYGVKGIAGLLISMVLLADSCILVMQLSLRIGSDRVDTLLLPDGLPRLRRFAGVLFILVYFSVTIIMIAGVASLGTQLLGLPGAAGGFVTTCLIMLAAYFGLQGMMTVFSVSTPVLILFAIGISLKQLAGMEPGGLQMEASVSNPLLGNFMTSAVNYAALNFISSFGILVPLTPFLKTKKTALAGMMLGGFFLFVIALFLILALFSSPESVLTDLPMLDLAIRLGRFSSVVYGVLLFLGMLGCGIATTVAVTDYMEKSLPFYRHHKKSVLCGLGLCAFLLSCLGFSSLVGSVYPVMGYLGILCFFMTALRLAGTRQTDQ